MIVAQTKAHYIDGYPKNIAVMADAGLSEFRRSPTSWIADAIEQFTKLELFAQPGRSRSVMENARLHDASSLRCPPCLPGRWNRRRDWARVNPAEVVECAIAAQRCRRIPA